MTDINFTSVHLLLFTTLLLGIYTTPTVFSNNANAQITRSVSIKQECLKGSEYVTKIYISGFIVPADKQGLILVNNQERGIFHGDGITPIEAVIEQRGIGVPFFPLVQDANPEFEVNIFAFVDLNSNGQYDDGEPSASHTFVPLNCNADIACPPNNLQHWTKIIFKITDKNVAANVNLPVNSELDITIMDGPSVSDENVVSDIKYLVGNYLERPTMPKNAIQIIDVEYSIACAYYEPEREFVE
ncbi:MAG: hypothetical protein DA329_08935 [Candidatus Nitrosocosmicus sp.]|nr:hypothetical protein [Candidatus Nitrosocosmicus sp.]